MQTNELHTNDKPLIYIYIFATKLQDSSLIYIIHKLFFFFFILSTFNLIDF